MPLTADAIGLETKIEQLPNGNVTLPLNGSPLYLYIEEK